MKIETADGQIIDLSPTQEKPKAESQKIEVRRAEAEQRIKERGTIQESVSSKWGKGDVISRGLAGAEVGGAPFSAIESAVANPALELQKGNVNPIDLIKQATLGATLQRQGQYGDVMKIAGFQPQVADTLGLILNLSPIKVANMVAKSFGSVSKMSDKTIGNAGKYLIDAVTEGKKASGIKVQQAFAPYDTMKADGLTFLNEFLKLPKVVQNKAESIFGKAEDFAQTLTIGRLRDFKRFLGKVNPGAYGKEARGIAENIEILDLNKGYSGMKKLLYNTLKSNVDEEAASSLMNAEEEFSKVMLASRYIRRAITDSVLLTPTKAGEFAKEIAKTSRSTGREAINTIKFTSKEAQKYVNRAMQYLEKYNAWERNKRIAASVGRTAFYGGLIAATGSKLARSVGSLGGKD